MDLVYYTLGFDIGYLDLLYVSIKSLRKYNTKIDILVISDKLMVDKCTNKLTEFQNVKIVPCTDSISAMDSSMKKLRIFEYDISKYEKVLFIDSDILVDIDLSDMFSKIVDEKLYAGIESFQYDFHTKPWHSLLNYTEEDLEFFKTNRIFVFNCGLFGFLNSYQMKTHFANILDIIKNYKGKYHYEQSFMNVYFNKRNLVNTNVINNKNYMLNINIKTLSPRPWDWSVYRNKIFHFCYARGADNKLREMIWWNKIFIPVLAVNNKTKK
jgi:lipopolysaccharide biosynthesis glycosyltransferase